jgi:hypothetical protein
MGETTPQDSVRRRGKEDQETFGSRRKKESQLPPSRQGIHSMERVKALNVGQSLEGRLKP